MFQCKEVKKILELRQNLQCFSKTKHLTLKHRNTQNESKSTNHESRPTTFSFLRGSLRCTGEKAKKAPLLQILIDVVEKTQNLKTFLASQVGCYPQTLLIFITIITGILTYVVYFNFIIVYFKKLVVRYPVLNYYR